MQLFPTEIDANWASPNGPRWHEALAARYAQAWREHLGEAYGMPVPEYVKVPCAATFAATKEALLRRPLSFYEDMRAWMLRTHIQSKWLGIVSALRPGLRAPFNELTLLGGMLQGRASWWCNGNGDDRPAGAKTCACHDFISCSRFPPTLAAGHGVPVAHNDDESDCGGPVAGGVPLQPLLCVQLAQRDVTSTLHCEPLVSQ